MATRNLFSEVLRLITPEELNILTTVGETEHLFSLGEMMEKEFVIERLRKPVEMSKAKILPFEKTIEKPLEKLQEGMAVQSENAQALAKAVAGELKSGEIKPEEVNSVRVTSESKLLQESAVVEGAPENEETKVLDMGDFILREKQRLKESQKKLKEKEVFGLYRKSASVDLEQEKFLKGDLSKSSNGGILINKKQL